MFDLTLIKSSILAKYPNHKNNKIIKISDFGTDNIVYRLGKDRVIRVPRSEASLLQLQKEIKIIECLSKTNFDIRITEIVDFVDIKDSKKLKLPIYKWIEGEDLHHLVDFSAYKALALELANFTHHLHSMNVQDISIVRRGLPLSSQDKAVKEALDNLEGEIESKKLFDLWNSLVETPSWEKEPVFIHADLLPTNLIIKNNKLAAVIDWSLAGAGDPAIDFIPAWSIFDEESRAIYKEAAKVDENTWLRAKGWALSIALIILPYYKNKNKTMCDVAKRILSQIK